MTEWIITSSLLILVVILLRRVLRGKISLRLQYALWLLVAIRLIVPGSLFESGLSILNLVDRSPSAGIMEATESSLRLEDIEYVPIIPAPPAANAGSHGALAPSLGRCRAIIPATATTVFPWS